MQVPNFDSYDNDISFQLPWEKDRHLFSLWKNGKTGYPWIDAAMNQLHREGWIHLCLRYNYNIVCVLIISTKFNITNYTLLPDSYFLYYLSSWFKCLRGQHRDNNIYDNYGYIPR